MKLFCFSQRFLSILTLISCVNSLNNLILTLFYYEKNDVYKNEKINLSILILISYNLTSQF